MRPERSRIAQIAEGLGGAHPDLDVRTAQGLQQQGDDALRGHAREGAHGALLDHLVLVAQQLEEQHGRVLVPEPPDARRCLGPHLGGGSWISGAASSFPHGGAIQARQRRLPWRTASTGWVRPWA
jgi:hypothetical protein